MASWLTRVLSRQVRGMSTSSSTFRSQANVTRKRRSPPLPRPARLYSQADVTRSQNFRPRLPRSTRPPPPGETPLWFKIHTVFLIVACPFQAEGIKQYYERYIKRRDRQHEFDLES